MVVRKIKEKAAKVREDVKGKALEAKQHIRNRTVAAIAAAFAFVIALVWRDAIRKVIDAFTAKLGIPETAYLYEFGIAIILTVVCVVGIMVVSKFGEVKK